MFKKVRVYFAHPMEGLQIPDESGKRAFEARHLLGDDFDVLIPEEWQASVPHKDIQNVDLAKLESADIILADYYRQGLVRDDYTVLGRGTNQEVGYAKGLNRLGKKKRPIIQVIRQTVNTHPFDRDDLVHNTNSLEEACVYIRKHYGKK